MNSSVNCPFSPKEEAAVFSHAMHPSSNRPSPPSMIALGPNGVITGTARYWRLFPPPSIEESEDSRPVGYRRTVCPLVLSESSMRPAFRSALMPSMKNSGSPRPGWSFSTVNVRLVLPGAAPSSTNVPACFRRACSMAACSAAVKNVSPTAERMGHRSSFAVSPATNTLYPRLWSGDSAKTAAYPLFPPALV